AGTHDDIEHAPQVASEENKGKQRQANQRVRDDFTQDVASQNPHECASAQDSMMLTSSTEARREEKPGCPPSSVPSVNFLLSLAPEPLRVAQSARFLCAGPL